MPIPLRPGAPMQHGLPPRMMHTRYYQGPPFGGGYNQAQMMNGPLMNRQMMMNGPMMNRNSGKKSGGILSKILGRGKQQGNLSGGMASFNRGASTGGGAGGILQSLTNPETLNGFLNNTQAVLKTAQQLGPMIEQYGPIVRNLPSLWKLYRGLKDASSDSPTEEVNDISTSVESSEEIELEDIHPIVDEGIAYENHSKKVKHNNRPLNNESKRSVPKLFI